MSREHRRELEPADLMTIAEAAKLVGVSQPTLRGWDEMGKFRIRRHPLNWYRLNARDDVMRLRRRIVEGRTAA